MIVGAVPYQKRVETDSATWNRIKRGSSLFGSTSIKELLTTRNRIPAFSEVCIVLKGGEAEFYHLPSKERLDLLGTCEFRVENHEICIGSKGESLLYAELNMRRLTDMHYRSQCQSMQRYVLVEQQRDERHKYADAGKQQSDDDQSPLFQTLTKTQTQVFDENNPLSISSRMHDRGNASKNTYRALRPRWTIWRRR